MCVHACVVHPLSWARVEREGCVCMCVRAQLIFPFLYQFRQSHARTNMNGSSFLKKAEATMAEGKDYGFGSGELQLIHISLSFMKSMKKNVNMSNSNQ